MSAAPCSSSTIIVCWLLSSWVGCFTTWTAPVLFAAHLGSLEGQRLSQSPGCCSTPERKKGCCIQGGNVCANTNTLLWITYHWKCICVHMNGVYKFNTCLFCPISGKQKTWIFFEIYSPWWGSKNTWQTDFGTIKKHLCQVVSNMFKVIV